MPKRKCVFTDILQKSFPAFRPVCKAGTYVSVSNGGARDLKIHLDTEKHKTAVRGESSGSLITQYFIKPGNEDAVNAAEAAWSFHTVKHHNSYRSMDCTSSLLKKTLPDSDTAKKFSCARTKTEAIVDGVLAPHSVEVAHEALKNIPFCGINTDGSNHGAVKIFPIIIQYFDWKEGGVQSKLIQAQDTPNETETTIANYLMETLAKNNLASKCIAFTGDNCNTNFGGTRRDEGGNNVFANLKRMLQNKTLIGVGCPAHILNNCVHHGADRLDYFHIYTVRTESLKEYCDFVDVEYRRMLSHSKTRWLSLFPGIERMLQMFPALKAFFSSQEKPPMMIKGFFENPLSEIYLWHMHSLMSVFHNHIQEMERENNSIIEVKKILSTIHNILIERKNNNFMSLKVKGLLAENSREGLEEGCDKFIADVLGMYSSCLEYLEKWITPMEEFSPFMWMDMSEPLKWNDVEVCIKYLGEKGVPIDDVKCFDQVANLKKFIESCSDDDAFMGLQVHQKWTKYFEKAKSIGCYSELLKIAQFAFALPPHNANVERIFSLIVLVFPNKNMVTLFKKKHITHMQR
uniref:HAT C-terminal dimerisation domain-containing protein n=1 Tax=Pygocentrus nattereri TaxID=42514 RepID=A0AAR2KN72_PYGNA